MKQPKAIQTRAITGIAVAVFVALGAAAPLGLTAPPAWAKICHFPDGLPYECQDWIPTNAPVPPDTLFLYALAQHQISAADGNNDVLINAGKAICRNIDNGATGAQEVAEILKAGKLRPDQAQAFVASAAAAYCPNHVNRQDFLGPGG